MSSKTYISDIEHAPQSQIGATLDALFATIESRKNADEASESYTRKLIDGKLESLLKKVSEETLETCLAAKECEMLAGDKALGLTSHETMPTGPYDASVDHMRYEAADVVYHLLVLLSRFGVSIDEFAAELNYRMREDERPEGCVLLQDEFVRRGK